MPSPKVKRAIRAFEKAIQDRTTRALSVPYKSHDWIAIEHNYVKARARLERLMENL